LAANVRHDSRVHLIAPLPSLIHCSTRPALVVESNDALGRDPAGVHYRSDSVRGLFVGEQQALGLLRDYSRTYNERFDGFVARKFNGDWVKITSGEVRPL